MPFSETEFRSQLQEPWLLRAIRSRFAFHAAMLKLLRMALVGSAMIVSARKEAGQGLHFFDFFGVALPALSAGGGFTKTSKGNDESSVLICFCN